MNPAIAGLLAALPRLTDAITDPLMGYISDNTRTRWGRRRPYIFFGAIAAGMDKGDGTADVYTDLWMPNRQGIWDKYVDGAQSVAVNIPYQGTQMVYVPTYMAEKGVRTVLDLAKPEVAAMFDKDGNGKGEMWIGAPGWASANVNEVKVRDYGLLDFIEPIRAEESVKTARVKDSIAKDEGYAFYCYKPHAIWYMFDVMMLTEPKFDPAKYVMVQPSDSPDWYNKSKVATKDALKNVQIAWSKSLKERSPAIAEFFERFKLTADDVSKFAFEISGKGREPSEVAKEWVDKNSQRVDGWLGL